MGAVKSCVCGGSGESGASGVSGVGQNTLTKQDSCAKSQMHTEAWHFIRKVPWIQNLPRDQQPIFAANLELVKFKKGDAVIKEGEKGTEFFIIKSGEATVEKKDSTKPVGQLKAGEIFGEGALFKNQFRLASVVVQSATLEVLTISRDKFINLGLHDKIRFPKRHAVMDTPTQDEGDDGPVPEKSAQEKALIAAATRSNDNLKALFEMSDETVEGLAAAARRSEIAAGEVVITEGSLKADNFYVVQEGVFEIWQGGLESSEGGQTNKNKLGELGPEASFGELALMYQAPRAATLVAKTAAVVWKISRANFKSVLRKHQGEKIAQRVAILNTVDIIRMLDATAMQVLAEALQEQIFKRGEVVIKQGDPGDYFYILWEGEVKVEKDRTEVNTLAASEGRGRYFGEHALLGGEAAVRNATITVVSATANILKLDRRGFIALLGPLEDYMQKKAEERVAGRKSLARHGSLSLPAKPEAIARQDLEKIALLGCGAFGSVELYKHKGTHETFAMKSMSKGMIVTQKLVANVLNEKYILEMISSDFLIRLHAAYNSKEYVSLLIEPALGGELWEIYQSKGFYGKNNMAVYYAAGVLCAFRYLHDRFIIYRDLKPENLLLSAEGHLKVTDMGLAKFVVGTTYSTCGTPEYFAPELIRHTGHTKAVDWWTLGILIYELLTGGTPFVTESGGQMQQYRLILQGLPVVAWPTSVSPAAKQLISSLLQKEPSARMPMEPNGLQRTQDCKWFDLFDWDAHQNNTMRAPYVPKVKSPTDASNFKPDDEDRPPTVPYRDDGSGWDADWEITHEV